MARKKKKFEEMKPDMTPMIDVTFLLLIFFIVTLKFKVLEGRLDAALPKDRGTSTAESEEIEKLDIMLYIAEPGELLDDPENSRLVKYQGRRVRIEIGTYKFYYKIKKGYDSLTDTFDKNVIRIDSEKSIDNIAQNIWENTLKILGQLK